MSKTYPHFNDCVCMDCAADRYRASSDFPKPMRGSLWFVIYEHREAVIRIAPDASGFFATGQEELWPFSEVQEWVKCIWSPQP